MNMKAMPAVQTNLVGDELFSFVLQHEDSQSAL